MIHLPGAHVLRVLGRTVGIGISVEIIFVREVVRVPGQTLVGLLLGLALPADCLTSTELVVE